MLIALLHQVVPTDASPDEQDVLVQAEAITAALQAFGHTVTAIPCDLNLARLVDQLQSFQPDLVFNLVESLNGADSLQALVPFVVESLRLPCTGSSGAAIRNSGTKGFAKSLLRSAGLPTPAWFDAATLPTSSTGFHPGRFILKPVFDHASQGMTDADVVQADDPASLLQQLQQKTAQFGRPCFAEAFIDGREFNLSLLQSVSGVDVLPPAEIRFVDYPGGKPRIVGSDAKWKTDSFEYAHTVRTFEFAPSDGPLLEHLADLARRCWHALDLNGYARVDFRVDDQGQPWILEANANPCLAPDAGFAAAAQKAGLTYNDLIQQIALTR